MGIFDFYKKEKKQIVKKQVTLFEKVIPLRIIKGKIIGHSINPRKRFFDKDGNILRYGDGMDDLIVRHQDYLELELYIKTDFEDDFIRRRNSEDRTTLYFETDKLFNECGHGDIIIYYGLYLQIGSIWTNYFIHNITKGQFKPLYFVDTINKSLFGFNKVTNELDIELNKEILKLTK